MKIGVLTSLYPSSVRPSEGVFAERRWSGMLERGHAVHVVHPLPWAPLSFGREDWAELGRMSARETRRGIEIVRPRYLHLPGRARRNAQAFARRGVRALLAKGTPDVVVADYAWPAAAAAPLLAERGIPMVISGRGSDVLQVAGEAGLGALLAEHLRRAGHWIAVSRHLVDAMDSLAGRPGGGRLVPNGVDTDLFRIQARDEARAQLARTREGVLVLVVGHLIPRKDPLLALETVNALAPRLRERSTVVFVGRGALREALDRRASELELSGRVEFVEQAAPERLATWYAAADVLLLTSSREGRPNVVLEALACGTPVLATGAGGTGELLDGLDGMLAASRDPRELAKMLAELLESPRDPRALRRHVGPLSWPASLDALEASLRDAIAARSRP